MSNESLRSFDFLQIVSWPQHVKTAWKYEATQSFIARGVANLKGPKLYCIIVQFIILQRSSVRVFTQSLCKKYCVTDQTKVCLNGYNLCSNCWGIVFLPAVSVDKTDLNTVVAALNSGEWRGTLLGIYSGQELIFLLYMCIYHLSA